MIGTTLHLIDIHALRASQPPSYGPLRLARGLHLIDVHALRASQSPSYGPLRLARGLLSGAMYDHLRNTFSRQSSLLFAYRIGPN